MNNKYFKIVDQYIDKGDISRHNSNLVYSVPAMASTVHGEVFKDYWFERVYGENIQRLHNEGYIYVHNTSILGPYCSGYSARDLALLGLNSNAPNGVATKPPKHINSLLGQCANFITLISQEIHGACAINDITTVVASYLYIHEEFFGNIISYNDLKNIWQSFIFNINVPFRGGNSAFSNITLSLGGPDAAVADEPIVYGGQYTLKDHVLRLNENVFAKLENDIHYQDIPKKYFSFANKTFIDAFQEGDGEGKLFTFPLITVNVYDDTDLFSDEYLGLLEASKKWGGLYFDNYRTEPFLKDSEFKHPFMQPKDPGSQKAFCCRLQIDLDVIKKINNGIFGSSSGVGGVGVFNINVARIAYISQGDKDLFYKILDYLMEECETAAQKKRKFILDNEELYPYFFFYNQNGLSSYFNIISVCGGHEAIIDMGYPGGLTSPEGVAFGKEVGYFIREKIDKMMIRDKAPINLEFAPAESAAPKLAKQNVHFCDWLETGNLDDGKYTCFLDDIKKQYEAGKFFE